MHAAYGGNKDIAIALAKKGSDLNIKSKVYNFQLFTHDDYSGKITTFDAICVYFHPSVCV